MNGVVTVAGVTLGLGLITWHLSIWWFRSKKHKVTDLIPFTLAWLYGVIAIIGFGGLVGWVLNTALWGSDWASNLVFVYGIGGDRQVVTRGSGVALTNGGLCILTLLTIVLAARLATGGLRSKALYMGVASGVLLGLSGSVAGAVAVPAASAVNAAGAWLSTDVMW